LCSVQLQIVYRDKKVVGIFCTFRAPLAVIDLNGTAFQFQICINIKEFDKFNFLQ
jgi:hypothetical protein